MLFSIRKFWILVFVLANLLRATVAEAAPAFPGAEGYGKNTVGGRGGRVIAVTNLNDSGAGSFRDAVGQSGPRIVVFNVSGTISLASALDITNPFLTIAGQTAPGDGIQFAGAAINIRASEVIVRNIRRRYDGASAGIDGIGIVANGSEIKNIILDHCSVSWGTDENLGINGANGGVRNVTVQHSIIAEGLTYDAGHSMGLLVNGWKDFETGPDFISVYHNLFANNQARNPALGNGMSVEVVNNVVYNWRTAATTMSNDSRTHYVGNYFKAGPSTNRADRVIDCVYVTDYTNVEMYLKGNIAATRPDDSYPEYAVLSKVDVPGVEPEEVASVTPVLPQMIPNTVSAAVAVTNVLANAGAFPRDSVDQRQVDSFLNDTGAFVFLAEDVGGLPVLNGGIAPVDTDGDGMPNDWEIAHGHNPNVDDGAEDSDGDGYTNVEDYLNSYFPDDATPPPSVTITAPIDGASFTAPATIALEAAASDADGTVTQVEFFNGTESLGIVMNAPYALSWADVPIGSYQLTAQASDDDGAITTSAVVAVLVEDANASPSVSLDFPFHGQSFAAPATISLVATAADVDGNVERVEFFAGDEKVGEDTSAPYSFALTGIPGSSIVFTARATDDLGAVTISDPVNVTVVSPPARFDFEDGDATAWIPDGPDGWTIVEDDTFVYRQTVDSTSSRRSVLAGSHWADQVVEADVRLRSITGANRFFGIVARYQSANSYYYFALRTNGAIELKKLVNGTSATLDAGTYPVTFDTWFRLRLEVIGTSLKAYIDNQLLLEAEDSEYAAGPAGLLTFFSSVDFDNVSVADPNMDFPADLSFEGSIDSVLSSGYNGSPQGISVATSPAGLPVYVTYNGSPIPPTLPGSYDVVASIDDPNYFGSAFGTLVIRTSALIRHAPSLNGDLDGSLQVLTGESFALNGNSSITGDLLLPGTPTIRVNGNPFYVGIEDGPGGVEPSDYTVMLNGNALVRNIVRRVDPIALADAIEPTEPAGTRDVSVNHPGQDLGDFSTIRNLILNGNAGSIALPPGAYGQLALNGSSELTLGDGASELPQVYDLQGLTLNGISSLEVVGPVVLRLANGSAIRGDVGAAAQPDWLIVEVFDGGLTLNGNAVLHGEVIAPNGQVIIGGNARIHGRVTADRLTINGNGLLEDPLAVEE